MANPKRKDSEFIAKAGDRILVRDCDEGDDCLVIERFTLESDEAVESFHIKVQDIDMLSKLLVWKWLSVHEDNNETC